MPARDCCEIQLWGVISGFVVPARELRNNSDPLSRHVRFTSKSGQTGRRFGMSALCQKRTHAPQHRAPYSITSSAMESTPDGTSMPSARAVCRLRTNSNLVDCRTGRSAGLAPFRILPL
jgi:hypothetical protein